MAEELAKPRFNDTMALSATIFLESREFALVLIPPSPKSASLVLTRVSVSRILLACVVEDELIRSRGILVSLHRSVAVLKNQTRPTRLYCDDPVLGCVSQE